MHDFPILFVALLIVLIVAVIIIGRNQEKKRTASLAALAPTIGFDFQESQWRDPSRASLQTALFSRGSRGRRFSNIMTGSVAGFDTSFFDYSFRTGSGKNRHTRVQSVVVFSQNQWLPLFEVRPEGMLDRLGDAFTHKDINFESHPGFSQRYALRGSDSERVRALFTPALLTYMEGLPLEKKWNVEGDGRTLVLYRSDKTVAPDDVRAFLEETSGIAKSFLSCCGAAGAGNSPR